MDAVGTVVVVPLAYREEAQPGGQAQAGRVVDVDERPDRVQAEGVKAVAEQRASRFRGQTSSSVADSQVPADLWQPTGQFP